MKSLAPPYQNVVSVAYKPSSVIGGHLSRPIVTDGFKRNPESIDGPSQSLFRFLLRAGFTSRTSRQAAGELLPHLSTLTHLHGRYISVALALESPPPAVNWHPALWCSDFPHALRHATIHLPQLRRLNYSWINSLPQLSHSTGVPARTERTTAEGSDMRQPPH